MTRAGRNGSGRYGDATMPRDNDLLFSKIIDIALLALLPFFTCSFADSQTPHVHLEAGSTRTGTLEATCSDKKCILQMRSLVLKVEAPSGKSSEFVVHMLHDFCKILFSLLRKGRSWTLALIFGAWCPRFASVFWTLTWVCFPFAPHPRLYCSEVPPLIARYPLLQPGSPVGFAARLRPAVLALS
jgi:hypothetical protein